MEDKKKCPLAWQFTLSPADGALLTGFLSSTSLTLRFSNGMIPLGSLSWTQNNRSVLQALLGCRDNPSSTHRGVLKVVETVVGENEPPPLPGLDPSACEAQSTRQSSSARKAERNKHPRTSSSSGRQTDAWQTDRQTQTDDGSTAPFTRVSAARINKHHGWNSSHSEKMPCAGITCPADSCKPFRFVKFNMIKTQTHYLQKPPSKGKSDSFMLRGDFLLTC